jgi:coatomer protein complex subunit gamma
MIYCFSQRDALLHDYLNLCLRNKYELVALEAARAIFSLRTSDPKEIGNAVCVLQLMLTSHKAAVRFAAVRTLNAVFDCIHISSLSFIRLLLIQIQYK